MTPMTILITGGGRGIGAATALAVARRGFDVVINYQRDAASAEGVAEQLRSLGRRAFTVQADVGDERQVLAMFERLDAEAGRLAGLVNNAGIVAMKARLDEMDVARWRRMMDTNVIGTLLCSREAVRRMSIRHGGAGGAIVNVSSIAAVLGGPAMYVDYAASKGAIDTFTIGLARELAAEGVRVNAVRPGIIDTDIHAASGDRARPQKSAELIPMQRPGRADEVAAAIAWLLSDEASYTTGALMDVSGGR
ncbi:SDR family oxidoreductase [Aquincola sp. S2]|uniref:SDR family oxidoreductase n=1 Tax=Pseudaquabacterium terrae TaxID=2732868 RepID=A0ABX2ELT5_9BURK|nr:SDR family oxidoreductase [Aquabacterium terrae]NRF69553.1 SDR family oxidoreductase [Aquabacterium terrae]